MKYFYLIFLLIFACSNVYGIGVNCSDPEAIWRMRTSAGDLAYWQPTWNAIVGNHCENWGGWIELVDGHPDFTDDDLQTICDFYTVDGSFYLLREDCELTGPKIDLFFLDETEWYFGIGSIGEGAAGHCSEIQAYANGEIFTPQACHVRSSSYEREQVDDRGIIIPTHEIGHALGMEDLEGALMVGVMRDSIQHCTMALGDHLDTYTCAYSAASVAHCLDNPPDGGASGLVSVDISNSTGVNIVQIWLEEWSDSDSILLEVSSTANGNYEEIGFEPLVDNVATFSTPVDLENKYLSITCMDDGIVDETFWYYHSNYQPERDYASMRRSNNDHIENPYWDDIAQGVTNPPLVSDRTSYAEYLIITDEEFSHDAAPLADMWEQQGLDVVLREYRPHVHDRSFVEDLIEYHFDHGLLKAVLIIGDVEGSVPSYMINDPRVSNMYANDNYYVDFNDDFIADIPIGRIPSTNWNEFVWYVFKVLDYMDSLSQSKILPDRYNKHVSLGVINDTSCGEIFGQREQVLDLADNISQIMSSYTNSTVELHTTEDNDDWYPGCISSEYRISMRDSIGSQYNNDPYIFSIVSEHQSVQSLGGIVPGLSWWRMNTSEGDVRSIVVNTTCFGAASTSYIYTHDAWINTWASYEINKGGSIAVIGASTFMPYEVQNQMLPVLMDTLYSSLHKAPINRMSIGESLVYASEAMSEQSSLAKSYMFACEIVGDPMLKLYNVDNSVGVEEPATLINFVQYKGSTLVFGRQNVSEQSVVKCEIYDIRGRRVYSKKVNLSGSNGQFELWNSVDSDGGKPIGSGVYLYRVIANDETFTGKMTIVR